MAQLQRWNKTYNLTALRDPEQMLVQHLFDSLAALPPLANILYKNTVFDAKIVDVGSGAGLPGVVLAALKPAWHVSCVDAVEKKTAFVRQMSGVLALPNLKAVHARVETLAPLDADVVVSRAFASLADFATLAGAHVGARGHLVAMKGREPTEEIETLHQQTPWRVDHIQPLVVPELNAQRCLVWMSRQGTP
jgi:16S rRNA (guanine527-N7)-methyltransferase